MSEQLAIVYTVDPTLCSYHFNNYKLLVQSLAQLLAYSLAQLLV